MSAALRFWKNRTGASAAEFALVLPGVIFLIFGSLNLCFVTYATVNLHSAVETAARYASTSTAASGGTDPGATAVENYAKSHYKGPGIGPTYTYVTTGVCGASSNGHQVSGSGSYNVFYGWGSLSVPISATACFP